MGHRGLRGTAGVVLLIGPVLWAAPPASYEGNCTDAGCHDQYTRLPVVHGPVESESCDDCHTPRKDARHKFELNAKGIELCTECHDTFEGSKRHDPADEDCTTCHDPHATKAAKLLIEETVRELCEGCHDSVTEDMAHVHGPVAGGACSACHNPHASNHSGLLTAEGSALCLGCHKPFRDRLAGAATKHDPVSDDCSLCHEAHGSAQPTYLNNRQPELCLDCHDEIGELASEAPVKHSPVTKGKACATCHDAHASAHAALLLKPSMQLCLDCHQKEITAGDRQVAGFSKLLEDRPHRHGPIQDGDCASCHGAAHGGERAGLLALAYPAGFYAPYAEQAYALCFDCHDAELAAEANTDDATEFRNGTRNLHHIHVNRPTKGRTCSVCHEVHASKQGKLLAEAVPFGQWSLPIGFEATDTGGSCATGCHRAYRYDRGTPVDNGL